MLTRHLGLCHQQVQPPHQPLPLSPPTIATWFELQNMPAHTRSTTTTTTTCSSCKHWALPPPSTALMSHKHAMSSTDVGTPKKKQKNNSNDEGTGKEKEKGIRQRKRRGNRKEEGRKHGPRCIPATLLPHLLTPAPVKKPWQCILARMLPWIPP
jgi:hypothetical protein